MAACVKACESSHPISAALCKPRFLTASDSETSGACLFGIWAPDKACVCPRSNKSQRSSTLSVLVLYTWPFVSHSDVALLSASFFTCILTSALFVARKSGRHSSLLVYILDSDYESFVKKNCRIYTSPGSTCRAMGLLPLKGPNDTITSQVRLAMAC